MAAQSVTQPTNATRLEHRIVVVSGEAIVNQKLTEAETAGDQFFAARCAARGTSPAPQLRQQVACTCRAGSGRPDSGEVLPFRMSHSLQTVYFFQSECLKSQSLTAALGHAILGVDEVNLVSLVKDIKRFLARIEQLLLSLRTP